MSRSVDLSVPRWFHALVAFVLIGGAFVTGFAALFDAVLQSGFVLGVGLAVTVYAALCAAWFLRARDGDDGSSVWSGIPDSQYTGRHAESGGIARKEQEDAIRELQERE
ncbi:hypothetical protein [Halosimplex salinum]|uniref:hypothetical protein n=1 Tax=Halosimplex salinum TaxID=1710538 RepID=UPI000F4616A9|nr:hypothetical protein [Halosimplex salinum]